MTGITPENVGKHGVLEIHGSRIVGKLTRVWEDGSISFRLDGCADENGFLATEWSFTPDAPKARLGMIVRVMRHRDYEDDYLVRYVDGWMNLANADVPYEDDEALAEYIANPVFPGVADL